MINIGTEPSLARVLELLLHELAHCALPRESHSERFIALVVRTARELWGVSVEGWIGIGRGTKRVRAYAVDERIVEELAPRLDAGAYVPRAAKPLPEPATPAERLQRAATARSARVDKREAKVRALLAEHEEKLRREQKLVRKYRIKVRRYDKIAASRGMSIERMSTVAWQLAGRCSQ